MTDSFVSAASTLSTDAAAAAAGHHPDNALRRISGRISDALNHTLEALHITHHHHDEPPKCELAQAVLEQVKGEMGDAFGAREAAFCDAACLQRYLRARGMDVGRAAAMLKGTLEWRRDFGVGERKEEAVVAVARWRRQMRVAVRL